MLDPKTRAHILGAIRRVWHRHPLRIGFLKSKEIRRPALRADGSEGLRDAVFYQCAVCGSLCKTKESGKYKQMHVDHVDPVVPVDQTLISLDLFAERLFVDGNHLQILCTDCHKLKSKLENAQRVRR